MKQYGECMKLLILGQREKEYLNSNELESSCPCSLKSISNCAGKLEQCSGYLLILIIVGYMTPPYMGIEFMAFKIFGQSSVSTDYVAIDYLLIDFSITMDYFKFIL